MCAIKLDMHKAYDRVEWPFLKEIMLKLGFRENWVNFIMECVSTVEYRLQFNAEETESFKPIGYYDREIIYLLIFFISMEGLTALLMQAEENGIIFGSEGLQRCPLSAIFFLQMIF